MDIKSSKLLRGKKWLLLIILLSGFSYSKDLINVPWDSTFMLRPTENGDTISIGAVFCDSTLVYFYNIANGTIVIYDTSGTRKNIVKLETIGRQTYAGDDFVARNNQLVFLNTIDRRLEIFDAISGKHLRAVTYPDNMLADQPSRAYRFVNRIFLADGKILLGNEHAFFSFDESMAKRDAALKTVAAPRGQRFAFVNSHYKITVQGSKIVGASCSSCRIPPTHFAINGKRFFLIGNKVYSLVLTKNGVQVIKIQ